MSAIIRHKPYYWERKKMDEMTNINLMKNECVENLMLISAFGETVYRRQALRELHRRRLINESEELVDGFMTTLSVVF